MKYKGFEIKKEQSHYVVIMQCPPDRGTEWREDTIKDAKDAIDEFLERRNNELPARV